MDGDGSSGIDAAQLKHFLVETGPNGRETYILTAEVERYDESHPDWAEVRKLFENGHRARELRAAPVKQKSAARNELSASGEGGGFGGVITMQIDLDGN